MILFCHRVVHLFLTARVIPSISLPQQKEMPIQQQHLLLDDLIYIIHDYLDVHFTSSDYFVECSIIWEKRYVPRTAAGRSVC